MPQQTTAPSRVFVIISTIVVALVLLLPSAGQANGDAVTTPYTVEAGDTLWDIAAEATASGGDVRSTVATIQHLNQLGSSVIQPGQVLAVPDQSD